MNQVNSVAGKNHLAAFIRSLLSLVLPKSGARPWIVSCPRSGSHFLRICVEKYTGGKSPLSNFHGLSRTGKFIHRLHVSEFASTHDYGLNEEYRRVIYLYRNPVDTIYSMLKYDDLPINRENMEEKLLFWVAHMQRWYFSQPAGVGERITVSYERLLADFVSEFSRVVDFLGFAKIPAEMNRVRQATTYGEVKKLTEVHDPKAVNTAREYNAARQSFAEQYCDYIIETLPGEIRALVLAEAEETGMGSIAGFQRERR